MGAKRWLAIAAMMNAGAAFADPAQITGAQAQSSGGGWQFSVTLSHGDTGWEDYADGWRVELADGTILGTRVLYHPHVDEQPFTRSLSGVSIPGSVSEVFIRAKTLTEGWGETRFAVSLN